MEGKKPSKKDIEKQEIDIIGQSLEDISTLTQLYVRDKVIDMLEYPEDKTTDTDASLLRVIDALNTPSEGKKYIVAYKSSFLFNRRGEVVKFRNIYPFTLALCPHFLPCLSDYTLKLTYELRREDEYSPYRFKYFQYTLKYLSNPTSKIYRLFKDKLVASI